MAFLGLAPPTLAANDPLGVTSRSCLSFRQRTETVRLSYEPIRIIGAGYLIPSSSPGKQDGGPGSGSCPNETCFVHWCRSDPRQVRKRWRAAGENSRNLCDRLRSFAQAPCPPVALNTRFLTDLVCALRARCLPCLSPCSRSQADGL
jgi:hypothetical protein